MNNPTESLPPFAAPAGDRIRHALEAALILCDTDDQRAFFLREIEALNAAPADVFAVEEYRRGYSEGMSEGARLAMIDDNQNTDEHPQSNQTCRSTNASPQGDECKPCTSNAVECKNPPDLNINGAAQGDELPPLPTLPQHLIGLIGEYGMARTDGMSELDRIDKWQELIVGIKEYASEYGAACRASAGAADALDAARLDFMERCVMEDGKCFSAEREYNPMMDEPTFGYLPTVKVFTVPSQHVRGVGLRGAIDAAMKKSDDAARNTQPGGAPDA